MNVALYGRVSTKDKGQDAGNQLAQLRTFAATQGWTVAHEYVDRVSGKHSDREQFQRLFRDASQWKFDLVLFWSLDIHDDFAILAPFQVHRVVTPPFFIKQEYPGTHRKRHPRYKYKVGKSEAWARGIAGHTRQGYARRRRVNSK